MNLTKPFPEDAVHVALKFRTPAHRETRRLQFRGGLFIVAVRKVRKWPCARGRESLVEEESTLAGYLNCVLAAKAKLVNTPELKDQRNATVLYVFAL